MVLLISPIGKLSTSLTIGVYLPALGVRDNGRYSLVLGIDIVEALAKSAQQTIGSSF